MNEFEFTPTYDTVCQAADRIRDVVVRTPLLESPALNKKIGARLLVKCETLQVTGSFKFRGAYNAISSLPDEVRARGVFAYSSGNHAQGIAHAAEMMNIPATILMPEDSPAIKISNTRGYGATVVTYDRYTESREEIGARIAEKDGLTLIKPYDNPAIVSGQGTIGLEIAQQLKEKGLTADYLSAPCGGGGLISGITLAMAKESPTTRLIAAEPENFDDTTRSLALGERVSNEPGHRSICDAIVTPMPGEITFPILQGNGVTGVFLTEREVTNAVRTAFTDLKIVVEPGGAVALAAYLSGKVDIAGKTVVAVCSGGNVDAPLFADILLEKL
ncbi:serine/threonine dehydratase [Sneathiella chinensis]|uniref:Serine/threonine dehydratase n=1 Tax=Sneathiella chinensis TaxID=349750 RepID=A0ABQ5U663_9PROT|nr:serine/threonine dehydratase [Sneathiella chinensis]